MKTADDDSIPAGLFDPLPVLDCRSAMSDKAYAFVMLAEITLWDCAAGDAGRTARGEFTPLAEVIEHHSAGLVTVRCCFCLKKHKHPASDVGHIVTADKCSQFQFQGRWVQPRRDWFYRIVDPGEYA